MLKNHLNKLINRYGLWRLVHATLAAGIVAFFSVSVLAVLIPVHANSEIIKISPEMPLINNNDLFEILRPKSLDTQQYSKFIRSGLFKALKPLRDKPMADKTIERIKSQLMLKCIIEIHGELVAYINVKGASLKKCKIGDSVSDLFTVLNINKHSVEISIIDHKVTLNL